MLVILQFIPPDPLSVLLIDLGDWPFWAALPGLLPASHWVWPMGGIGRRWKSGGGVKDLVFFFFYSVYNPVQSHNSPTIVHNPYFELQLWFSYPDPSSLRVVMTWSCLPEDAVLSLVCSLNTACTFVLVSSLDFLQSFWEYHPHTQNLSQFLYLGLIPPFSVLLV